MLETYIFIALVRTFANTSSYTHSLYLTHHFNAFLAIRCDDETRSQNGFMKMATQAFTDKESKIKRHQPGIMSRCYPLSEGVSSSSSIMRGGGSIMKIML